MKGLIDHMKRIVAAIVSAVMLLAMTACGDGSVKSNGHKYYEFFDSGKVRDEFDKAEHKLSPDSVYEKINYTEKMFYGSYTLYDMEKDVKSFQKTTSFVKRTLMNGKGESAEVECSFLPVAVAAGFNHCAALFTDFSAFDGNREQEWACVTFVSKSGKLIKTMSTFRVSGNKLIITPLKTFTKEFVDNNYHITYELGDTPIEYKFTFGGLGLKLTGNGDVVRLKSFPFTKEAEESKASQRDINCCAAIGSPRFDGMDSLTLPFQGKGLTYASDIDGKVYGFMGDYIYARLRDDGLMEIIKSETNELNEKQVTVREFACFFQGSEDFFSNCQLVLCDGETVYYYTETRSSREKLLNDMGGLSDSEIEARTKKRSELLGELETELNEAGISAVIDRATGDVSLDATVLFAGDSAKISDSGKKLLNKFMPIYTKVVYNEKYKGLIANTMVEGHTAPLKGSTYESGLALSKERATNVRKYCLTVKTSVDKKTLGKDFKAVGKSNSFPVYDNNGEINLAASRRVSFRLVLNNAKD